MNEYFADLHIHIGWAENGQPVKISSSKRLTFYNILYESLYRKGLNIIGIVDTHSPAVQEEILMYIDKGLVVELSEGGLKYEELTIFLGTEIEIKEEGRGAAHFLVFLPFLKDMINFRNWLAKYMKNVNLSSQRLYVKTKRLQLKVKELHGLFIPAHIFTPHKSVYGRCCNRMSEIMDLSLIDAVELGLSSDTYMADRIDELNSISFLSNSDAHSLNKIGREYNKLLLNTPATFEEFRMAIHNKSGRKILANYGLDPSLGKYNRSRCKVCGSLVVGDVCTNCGSNKIIKGVSNRIEEIADYFNPNSNLNRPPYIHQIPLEFIPKLGKKTLEKLIVHFGSEMNILHKANEKELLEIVPKNLVDMILKARKGEVDIKKGGGGIYGKVLE